MTVFRGLTQLSLSPLTDIDRKSMLDAWKEKGLVVIPANGDIDYFCVFNDSSTSRSELKVQAGPFQ